VRDQSYRTRPRNADADDDALCNAKLEQANDEDDWEEMQQAIVMTDWKWHFSVVMNEIHKKETTIK
jgi:hypothetical protein